MLGLGWDLLYCCWATWNSGVALHVQGLLYPLYMLSCRHLLSLLLLHALILAHALPKIYVSLQRRPIPLGNPCPYGHVLSLAKCAVPLQTCCPFRHLLSLKTHSVSRCVMFFQTQGVPQMYAVLMDVTCTSGHVLVP